MKYVYSYNLFNFKRRSVSFERGHSLVKINDEALIKNVNEIKKKLQLMSKNVKELNEIEELMMITDELIEDLNHAKELKEMNVYTEGRYNVFESILTELRKKQANIQPSDTPMLSLLGIINDLS